MRTLPNIIITGTPGVGKTTTCTQLISLASELPLANPTTNTTSPSAASASASAGARDGLELRHLCVNALVREKGCHEGWDAEMGCWIVDDEAVADEVERVLLGDGGEEGGEGGEGGWVIDWHACDVFAKSWVDLVVVLRCGRTEVLWDRLKARDYPEAKLQENIDAEIFGVLLEEAQDAFDEGMVVELKSETVEDVEENCERILRWIQTWRENQRKQRLGRGEGEEHV